MAAIVTRQGAERTVVARVVADLITAGFSLSLHEGGGFFPIQRSTDVDDIVDAMGKVDEETLLVHTIGESAVWAGDGEWRKAYGWVAFIYGNSHSCWEGVVHDYTTNLEFVFAPIKEWIKAQEANATA